MNDLLTVEDTLLDEMLGHEAGCESRHDNPDNLVCSGAVVYRFSSVCGVAHLLCSNAGDAVRARIMGWTGRHCGACLRGIEDDWQVLPA